MRKTWKLYAFSLALVFVLAGGITALWPGEALACFGCVCPTGIDGNASGWATDTTCTGARDKCRWDAQGNADSACVDAGSIGACRYSNIVYSTCNAVSGGFMVDCTLDYTCWDYE